MFDVYGGFFGFILFVIIIKLLMAKPETKDEE